MTTGEDEPVPVLESGGELEGTVEMVVAVEVAVWGDEVAGS
jgi:hypothetical protein